MAGLNALNWMNLHSQYTRRFLSPFRPVAVSSALVRKNGQKKLLTVLKTVAFSYLMFYIVPLFQLHIPATLQAVSFAEEYINYSGSSLTYR